MINIDASNQPNLSSFKSTSVSVGGTGTTATISEVNDLPAGNFIRGPVGNASRNSSRSRARHSAGIETSLAFAAEGGGASKSMDQSTITTKAPVGLAPTRAFISGHSRAASADISNYSTVGHGKQQQQHNNHNSTAPTLTTTHQSVSIISKPESNLTSRSRNIHHVRNNSVDNSLVTSGGYQAFAINSGGSQTNIVTGGNALSVSKPAIPAKPSGIVSVFVPGSTTNLSMSSASNSNKSTGNIYSKVTLNNNNNSAGGGGNASSSSSFNNREPLMTTVNQIKPAHPSYQAAFMPTGASTPVAPNSHLQKTNSALLPVPPPRKVCLLSL